MSPAGKQPGVLTNPRRSEHEPGAALTCSREEVVPVLVEGHGHDSVRQVEGLLDPVAMVNVDVDVQNAGVVPATHMIRKGGNSQEVQRSAASLEKLQDADDDVVHVAKPRRLQTKNILIRK